ncbi:hypothetical protein [Neorhodopirellula pilleata]|uniref:Transmembrane protein n=1 Tax=Neorhodopirellula pilleata TaxID=2714738 RepID=A0A5C6APV2_9BACT|nr:hypothetical protein [Neorhodopirellula pilleata]TWU02063.1 hypothetical protein Pla100_18020 [Neorhodopirellula pilleata]
MEAPELPPVSPTPEQSLLANLRNWTDVFPWLRLVKVCRVAGGPVWIVHSVAALVLWWMGLRLLHVDLGGMVSDDGYRRLFAPSSFEVVGILWTWLLALPHMMAFVRVGALLTAGREIPSYLGTWKLVGRRLSLGALILILPVLSSLPFVIAAWVCTTLASWLVFAQPMADWVSMLWIVPSLIVAGLLLVGAKAAVPLALVSLMTEAKPDAMDSLSRGYEYALRRLPQVIGYALVAIMMALPVLLGWGLVLLTAWWVAIVSGAASGKVMWLLIMTGAAIAMMLITAMIGGVYLLLRRSAGGQEIADVWAESEGWIAPPMPSVRQNKLSS